MTVKPIILIAEDNEALGLALKMRLQDWGIEAILCADGECAFLEYQRLSCEGMPLHILFTDGRMPRMGGVELIAKVVEEAKINNLSPPYIILNSSNIKSAPGADESWNKDKDCIEEANLLAKKAHQLAGIEMGEQTQKILNRENGQAPSRGV